jgi:hypothetical protein
LLHGVGHQDHSVNALDARVGLVRT